MGLAARLRGLLRRDTSTPPGPASDPLSWWGFWYSGSFGPSLAGPAITPHNAPGLPVFSACVSLISQALATERWQIERDLPDGGMVPVSSSANAMLTRMSYADKERFISSALVSGNGYLVNVGGDLQALEWQNVAVMYTGPGEVSYVYYQPLTGQHTQLAPEQLAILRYRNWGRLPWQGIPPCVVNATTVSIGMAAQHTAASAFRNGATPGGYLSTDHKLDPQKALTIQARWNENYSSALNAGKTAVLEQGLKYQLVERQNLVEIQMAELAKANDADVARAFNVPLMVLGEITANRANSVEATRLFVSMCLETMAARVGDAVGLFVLTPAERSAGLRVVINLRRLTRGFGVELADAQSKEVLAGIKSRNEARAEQGLAGSPDTAPFLVPVNMETTEQAQQRSDRANAESAAAIAAREQPKPEMPVPANLAAEIATLFGDAYLDELERLVDGVEERQAELPVAAE
jgi:HK97 family phage portal protein